MVEGLQSLESLQDTQRADLQDELSHRLLLSRWVLLLDRNPTCLRDEGVSLSVSYWHGRSESCIQTIPVHATQRSIQAWHEA